MVCVDPGGRKISLSAIDASEGHLIMAAVRDVAQRRQQQDELERVGRRDASVEFGTRPAGERARVCCYVRDNGPASTSPT